MNIDGFSVPHSIGSVDIALPPQVLDVLHASFGKPGPDSFVTADDIASGGLARRQEQRQCSHVSRTIRRRRG